MAQPVLVLQFMADDGPGHLGAWLRRRGVAVDLRNTALGDAFPQGIRGYRGLAVLGGAMSANDDLAFLRSAERLILDAMRADVPVLGHCLGGQLMARALGAGVHASPAPEVGWHEMQCVDSAAAKHWFGSGATQTVFHWHYEAFEVPDGAELLAGSTACPNQAFAVGRHLALQFHVEIDQPKIEAWLGAADASPSRDREKSPTIHTTQTIRQDTPRFLPAQQALADRVYANWLSVAG
jgi:GMP synthase-like glutamine amidotransferase